MNILTHDSTFLFFDATFHTCPKPFYQVLNIMASYKGVVIPVFHVYMTSKSAPLYEQIFLRLRALFHLQPSIANTDFEAALTRSLKRVFNAIQIHGCRFHYSQAVFRAIMGPSKIFIMFLYEYNFNIF
jgi:hypothetical protein